MAKKSELRREKLKNRSGKSTEEKSEAAALYKCKNEIISDLRDKIIEHDFAASALVREIKKGANYLCQSMGSGQVSAKIMADILAMSYLLEKILSNPDMVDKLKVQ